MQTVTVDDENFEIPDGWFLGYLIECTETEYYTPPLTYYGPRKSMWRAYEIRKNLLSFRTFSPNKGKNMNDNEIREELALVDAPSVAADYYIDAEGNRIEIPFDVASDGEATQQETAFIAEDGADHPTTVN